MYKIIWDIVNRMDINRKLKQRIFISVNVMLYFMLGLLLWLIFGMKTFKGDLTWFICFAGYPSVLLGFFGSILMLFKLDQ